MNALEVDGISHSFPGRQALSDVSLSVGTGTFTVLLGPNGAGKTTLISLITRLYNPQKGDVRIFGHSIRWEPLSALAHLGVVFQMPTLDLDLSVAENFAYHGSLHGLSRAEAVRQGTSELERLGAADRLKDTVRTLSGGLRRRVEIARSLLHGPRLLVVDEATAGLDVASRQLLLQHLRALCLEGLSVLWTTHMLDEIEPGDPLVVLNGGRVAWQGGAGELAGGGSLEQAFLQLTERAP